MCSSRAPSATHGAPAGATVLPHNRRAHRQYTRRQQQCADMLGARDGALEHRAAAAVLAWRAPVRGPEQAAEVRAVREPPAARDGHDRLVGERRVEEVALAVVDALLREPIGDATALGLEG